MKAKFPKQIYVAQDPNNDTGKPAFLADADRVELVDGDGPTEVATYELKSVVKLCKVVKEGN